MGEFLEDGFRANLQSWGFVYNTLEDLEGVYLEHLKRDLGHDRVWAVGPLSLLGPGRQLGSSGPHTIDEDLLAWLDGQEEGSVLYVCFGSQVVLSPAQTEAVAAGLERSGAHFVWFVRGPTPATACGTDGRGRVVRGWAPQVELLNHPAVGSFLTHCGWNSLLEGISAGVAMLLWPMGADQFYNARLLEEDVRIGARVCEGRETVPDSDKLGRLVAEVVGGSGEEKARAKELRRKALAAVREGGSSYRDADELVKMLNKVKM